MARKVQNRRALREEIEAAERTASAGLKPAKAGEAKTKRKARPKTPKKEVRLKAFWGVFTQTLTPVAMFEYGQRAEAQKKAQELTESRKSPHFVQLVKKVIEE